MSTLDIKTVRSRLSANGVVQFDPVRFTYIQSLVRRFDETPQAENTRLGQLLQASVDDYLHDLELARCEAEKQYEAFLNSFPEYRGEFDALFQNAQYKQLMQLGYKLKIGRARSQGVESLRDLNQHLNQSSNEAEDSEGDSIDDLLSQQTKSLLKQKNDGEFDTGQKIDQVCELKARKGFVKSSQYSGIDRRLDRAINQRPLNPGPLNPHMLAVKSLSRARSLSPSYLRRFAVYLETLIWLDKTADK